MVLPQPRPPGTPQPAPSGAPGGGDTPGSATPRRRQNTPGSARSRGGGGGAGGGTPARVRRYDEHLTRDAVAAGLRVRALRAPARVRR